MEIKSIYEKYQKQGMRFCNVVENSKSPYNYDEINNKFTRQSSDQSGVIKWSEKPFLYDQVERAGVLGGYGGFVIIDIDKNFDEAINYLKKYLPMHTFVVESGKSTKDDRRCHIYYKIKDAENFKYKRTHKYGEIIWFGSQALAAGNIHPDTKKPYKVFADNSIEEISAESINNFLETAEKDQIVNDNTNLIQHRNSKIIRTILDNDQIMKKLSETEDISKNDILFKNIAIFHHYNLDYESKCYQFVELCNHSIQAYDGWLRKAESMSVNDFELQKWIVDYNLQGIIYNEDNYKGLDVFNEKDVLNWKDDNNFIIKNLIYENTVNMIYAPPASFKSFFSLYLSMCLASGENLFDHEINQCNVLYLDKENPKASYKNRYNGLLKGCDLKTSNKLFTYKAGNILDDSFILNLRATIKHYKIKVIVLDTLHRFGDYNEDKADDLNRIYSNCFQPIAEELSCTVIFLHHTTKEVTKRNYRGSSDLEGMCDGIFFLERIVEDKVKTNKIILKHIKNRHGRELDNILFQLNIISNQDDIIETAKFELLETDYQVNKTEKVKQLILAKLKQSDMYRKDLLNEIKKHDDKFSDILFDKLIKELSDENIIQKVIDGRLVQFKLNNDYKRDMTK